MPNNASHFLNKIKHQYDLTLVLLEAAKRLNLMPHLLAPPWLETPQPALFKAANGFTGGTQANVQS
jgi:hypothetical protein